MSPSLPTFRFRTLIRTASTTSSPRVMDAATRTNAAETVVLGVDYFRGLGDGTFATPQSESSNVQEFLGYLTIESLSI